MLFGIIMLIGTNCANKNVLNPSNCWESKGRLAKTIQLRGPPTGNWFPRHPAFDATPVSFMLIWWLQRHRHRVMLISLLSLMSHVIDGQHLEWGQLGDSTTRWGGFRLWLLNQTTQGSRMPISQLTTPLNPRAIYLKYLCFSVFISKDKDITRLLLTKEKPKAFLDSVNYYVPTFCMRTLEKTIIFSDTLG